MAASTVKKARIGLKARMGLKDAAANFIDFVNKTGSPYHAVSASTELLRGCGFVELAEEKPWALQRGGKYFVTKDGSEVMAFVVGGKFMPAGGSSAQSGFSAVGAHTDSPCLRLRPNSKITSQGMLQVGIETYGGGLWHTWFDRPLGLAGKVVVRQQGVLAERLVHIQKPLLLLPNLAIHLTTAAEREGFAPNKETHLQPVLCSQKFDEEAAATAGRAQEQMEHIFARHHTGLLEAVAKELSIEPKDIVDMDLCFMDAQPSCLVGLYEEFISSPRIDNVLSTWAAIKGLCDFAVDGENVENSQDVCLAVAFDHEEVGSQSATGASSETLPSWLERILACLEIAERDRPQVYARSFMVSADCAHAIHPNYAAKHQAEHRPDFHKGIVIKSNANQRYATTAMTASLLREVCKGADVPVQDFIVRNDSPCGSTIGPITSAKLGIRTIDVGAPQWAMHSIRESCASSDAGHLLHLCEAFYESFRRIDSQTSTV